jgi:hypothetical protein
MSEKEALFGPGRSRDFSPYLAPKSRKAIHDFLRDQPAQGFTDELRALARKWTGDAESAQLRAICLLVADLSEQGWQVCIDNERILFEPPGLERADSETVDDVKARVRRGLLVARNRQLEEPSVRRFLARMERRVLRDGRRTCVLDLVDDGNVLAAELAAINALPEADRPDALAKVIEPVVEVCSAGTKCPDTNLDLVEVWRYFRHTWALEYRSVPGRQMMFLIRNAARPNRPVMGIAMLASPVMRLKARDSWIGWLREDAEERLKPVEVAEPGAKKSPKPAGPEPWKPETFANALLDRLEASLADIRWDDLVTAAEMADPTEEVALALQQAAAGAAFQREKELKRHFEAARDRGERVRPLKGQLKPGDDGVDWTAASDDLLFVRKRAEALSLLLFAKHIFRKAGLADDPEAVLPRLFADRNGQRAIDIALSELRKAGLSSRVADVSVCGAIAPYNELLGGKLVALLLASAEVRQAYADRYGGQISVIASQMAGRPVTKPADLALLTTTSLYGLGSSQYNRLALSAAAYPDLDGDLRWLTIGRSLTGGYGTLHLGGDTVDALREIGEARHDARRINNRFGEGTSPRMRQVREGLEALGVRSDDVLHHATPRIFYGCELGDAAKEALMGLRAQTASAPTAKAVGDAWRRRWVVGRMASGDVRGRLAQLGPRSVWSSLHADADGQLLLPLELD